MRTYLLIGALAALPSLCGAGADARAQDADTGAGTGTGADASPVAAEEAAALYFAPPPTEEADPVIDQDGLPDAGTVQLAFALGKVEEGLSDCQALRRQMQTLIGDTYGSYSVNPGWLKRYQTCVLIRAEEVRAVGQAIRARQTDLISRIGQAETEDDASAEDAMRAADLMARLSARQSDVKIEIAREGRRQRAFVRYYNTGEFPDALREERETPQMREVPDAAPDLAPPAGEAGTPFPPEAVGGAILREGEAIEGGVPAGGGGGGAPVQDTLPPENPATGAPIPLRAPATDDGSPF